MQLRSKPVLNVSEGGDSVSDLPKVFYREMVVKLIFFHVGFERWKKPNVLERGWATYCGCSVGGCELQMCMAVGLGILFHFYVINFLH